MQLIPGEKYIITSVRPDSGLIGSYGYRESEIVGQEVIYLKSPHGAEAPYIEFLDENLKHHVGGWYVKLGPLDKLPECSEEIDEWDQAE